MPIKQISRRQLKRFSKPWITQGIRASIKTKNKLFASGDQTKYKFYRNKINHLIRISKRGYFHDYFEKNLQNMKKKLHVEAKLILLKRKLRIRIKNLDFNVTKFTIYLMIIVFILCSCFILVKEYASTCFLGVTYTTHSHVHFSNLDSFRV